MITQLKIPFSAPEILSIDVGAQTQSYRGSGGSLQFEWNKESQSQALQL